MLTREVLGRALSGLRGLLLFRTDAFDRFDGTIRGFWTSFWAAALVLPVWSLAIFTAMPSADEAGTAQFVAVQLIGYAVSWLAYPLLMVRVSDYLGRWPQYFRYMVAYNWFQVAEAVVFLPPLALAAAGAPPGMVALSWLTIHGVLITYHWFIARRGLQVDAGAASALVIIDLLLGLLIDRLAETLV
jgi:hypothetical protein